VPARIDDETAGAVLLQGLTAQYLTRSTYPARLARPRWCMRPPAGSDCC